MAKQRYLKRKARRHKVLAKAKKASAPKRIREAHAEATDPESSPAESANASSSSDESESEVEEQVAPLAPFPIAVEPAGPDPGLLKRQGLPAGLENASFIHPNRAALNGVDNVLQTRLKAMGVQDLFAGTSTPNSLTQSNPPWSLVSLPNHFSRGPTISLTTSLSLLLPVLAKPSHMPYP